MEPSSESQYYNRCHKYFGLVPHVFELFCQRVNDRNQYVDIMQEFKTWPIHTHSNPRWSEQLDQYSNIRASRNKKTVLLIAGYVFYRMYDCFSRISETTKQAFWKVLKKLIGTFYTYYDSSDPSENDDCEHTAIFHYSRGLLEDSEEIIEEALSCVTAFTSVIIIKDDNFLSEVRKKLNSIYQLPCFKSAVTKLYTELRLKCEVGIDELMNRLSKLEIKIMKLTGRSLAGMITPEGFVLHQNHVASPGGDPIVKATKIILSSIHEIGHILVRYASKNGFDFFNCTPPNKTQKQLQDEENEDLDAGHLFSAILFGTYSKALWDSDWCVTRLLNLNQWPKEPPVFTEVGELEKLKTIGRRNCIRSGIMVEPDDEDELFFPL